MYDEKIHITNTEEKAREKERKQEELFTAVLLLH